MIYRNILLKESVRCMALHLATVFAPHVMDLTALTGVTTIGRGEKADLVADVESSASGAHANHAACCFMSKCHRLVIFELQANVVCFKIHQVRFAEACTESLHEKLP